MATSSIPSKISNVVSEENRDLIPASIVSDFLFYKMHEGTGNDLVDAGGSYPTITMTDASPDWTTEGYFTPDGSTTVAELTAAQSAALFRLDDIPNGCVLVMFDIISPAGVPPSNMEYFCYGDHGDEGGYGVFAQNSTSTRFIYRSTDGTNTAFSAVNTPANQRNSICMLLDRSANQVVAYLNGASWDNKVFADANWVGSMGDGFSLFREKDGGNKSTIPMRNFFAIKMTTTPNATIINQLVLDHWNHPGLWSWSLEGL